MPCFQQRTTEVELAAANLDVMEKALAALGMQTRREGEVVRVVTGEGLSGYYTRGRLVINGAVGLDRNALAREYSKQSIVATAKRQGWQLRFQSDGRIEATRRRFS